MKLSGPNRRNIPQFNRGTEKFSRISIRAADIKVEKRIKCYRMNF